MSSFSIEAEITFNQSFGMSWRFAPTYRALLVAVLPVLLAGCSSRFGQKPKPYILPDELTITAHAERGPEVAGRAIHIAGSTNFPDGMKMWVQVEDGRFPPCTARIKTSNNTDYNVIVQDGRAGRSGARPSSRKAIGKPTTARHVKRGSSPGRDQGGFASTGTTRRAVARGPTGRFPQVNENSTHGIIP